ncbi:MAG TPA: hypothetical protein VIM79_06710 [Niastella sp.]
MKQKLKRLLLAAILIGSFGMQQALANNSSIAPGHPASTAPAKSRVSFNRYSLELFDQHISKFKGTVHLIKAQSKSLTNSTLTNHRSGNKSMVIPLLTVYFSDKDPEQWWPDEMGTGMPNGTTVAFDMPDLTNITSMSLLCMNGFNGLDVGVLTTNDGAVQINGYTEMTDYWLWFYLSAITNGVHITVY